MWKRSPTELGRRSAADSRPCGPATLCGWGCETRALQQAHRGGLWGRLLWPCCSLGLSSWGPSDSGLDLPWPPSGWPCGRATPGPAPPPGQTWTQTLGIWSGWHESTGRGRVEVETRGRLVNGQDLPFPRRARGATEALAGSKAHCTLHAACPVLSLGPCGGELPGGPACGIWSGVVGTGEG